VTDEARRQLRRADPHSPDSIFRAVAVAVREGLAQEALPVAEAGASRWPGDPRMWQVLGLAQRALEDSAGAIDAFARAARLAPLDPLIAHSLARVTLVGGLPATALFDRARTLAPNDGSVLLGRAAAQFAQNEAEAAIADLDQVLDRHPLWTDGHAALARLRWMSGARDVFTASLERALHVAPGESALWLSLIDMLMSAERYADALAVIARARAAAGANRAFDRLEAACVAERGEIDAADRLFAALGPPEDGAAALRYARHLLRSRRPGDAAAAVEPWLESDPSHALWPYAATAWRMTGDPRWMWLEGDPRFVGVYDIGDKVGGLDALADRLRALHLAVDQPLDQTLRGGTQTDGALFARIEPEIRALRAAILAAVEAHVARLPARDPRHPLLGPARAPIRFAGSWSVRLAAEGFHINHVHSAGWISSAFYVALPQAHMGGPAHAGWLSLGEVGELGLDLPPIRLVEPKPGRLVLFPSTMWHGTRPFAGGERLTVAFDVARCA
jgi:tetratricopeptide (TPR) repeat protein